MSTHRVNIGVMYNQNAKNETRKQPQYFTFDVVDNVPAESNAISRSSESSSRFDFHEKFQTHAVANIPELKKQNNFPLPSPRSINDPAATSSNDLLGLHHSTPRSQGHSSRTLSPRARCGKLLSPKYVRVDYRYMSRLPPSFGGTSPRHSQHQNNDNDRYSFASLTSSSSSKTSHSLDDIKRNLFLASTLDTSFDHDGMDESEDIQDSMDLVLKKNISDSTSFQRNLKGSSVHSPSRYMAQPSPGHSVYSEQHTPWSPSNSDFSGGSDAVVSFLNSPSRRGLSTLVNGNTFTPTISNSSVASSPSSRTVSGISIKPTDEGEGDRFIPSRVSSNLSFSLPLDSVRSKNVERMRRDGRRESEAEGNNRNGLSNRSSGTSSSSNMEINMVSSFGATMMGGRVPADLDTSETDGVATDMQTISPTFSDDAASSSDGVDRHDASTRQPLLYDALLRSELLGENFDPSMQTSMQSFATSTIASSKIVTPFREKSNNLRFVSPRLTRQSGLHHDCAHGSSATSIVNSFNLSPVSLTSNQRSILGTYADQRKRKIPKVSTKVLDAPSLQDDFYLNLVDWGSHNILAVGLGNTVYLWSASTSHVTKLVDLSGTEDAVTSVAWSEGGRHLAVGTTRGDVQLWDAFSEKIVRVMSGHSARVGALSWKGTSGGGGVTLLASGSRDRLIYLRDPRSDQPFEARLCAHKQEVCGLKWSFGERSVLASGGNDNKLLVWDIKKHSQPCHTFGDHTAAVKAIAWSPHQHGLLASGGGTADRCIRFSNCLTGQGVNCIDTGSQVCNLAWSKNCNEIVSTHGYSLNQIVVWKYPTMTKMATLTGHTYRVLYLSVSPDGSTIVTGAGDETLRFWQVFPGPQKEGSSDGGLLFPSTTGSVIR